MPFISEKRSASIFQLIHEVDTSSEVLDLMGVVDKGVHRACPESCKSCDGVEFAALELISFKHNPMFWECLDCGRLYCRMIRKNLIGKIDKLKVDIWTNPNDWEMPNYNQMN